MEAGDVSMMLIVIINFLLTSYGLACRIIIVIEGNSQSHREFLEKEGVISSCFLVHIGLQAARHFLLS